MYIIPDSGLASYLTSVELALTNARAHPDIAAALAAVGYDAAVIGQGEALLQTARGLYETQVREYGEQYAATAAFKQALEAADAVYNTHRRLAQLAFKNDLVRRKTLALDERRGRTVTRWLNQATRFYTAILSDDAGVAALGRFNLSRPALEAAHAQVQQVAALKAAQEREKAEAQQATKRRDAAIDALDDWFDDFREVARIALAANPQLLEALQIGAIP